MTNPRHIPDLQAAEECISQAITAAKRHDPAFVEQCVTAAIQYLTQSENGICDHHEHTLSIRYNSGSPAYTCDGCNTIVGLVKFSA